MKGFSLIELTIVLAIIGILISFSYPIYQEHFVRVHRDEAKNTLLQLANEMELHYTNNQQYQNLITPKNEYYQFVVSDLSKDTYILKAISIDRQRKMDKKCQVLTLNHLGQRRVESGSIRAPFETPEVCWN